MMMVTERRLDLNPSTGSGNSTALEKAWAQSASDSAESAKFLADELNELRREHAKLQQAIFEAAQVQRTLCAPRELSWRQFDVAGEIFPVRHLSGDFFKVMKLRSALALVVGDIVGKGMTAGIWQAHVMGLVQRSARKHADAAAVVTEVNQELCQDAGEAPMTALFFARIDAQKNELTYCNGGLPAALLLREDKTLERLEEGGPMLGAVPNGVFKTGKVTLNPGDMLVAYSDGVTECRNPQDQEFEMDRLATAVGAVSGVNASQALFSLLGTVLDFADSCPPGDDVTLLVLRRNRAGKTEQAGSRAKSFSAPRRRPTSGSLPKDADRGRGPK